MAPDDKSTQELLLQISRDVGKLSSDGEEAKLHRVSTDRRLDAIASQLHGYGTQIETQGHSLLLCTKEIERCNSAIDRCNRDIQNFNKDLIEHGSKLEQCELSLTRQGSSIDAMAKRCDTKSQHCEERFESIDGKATRATESSYNFINTTQAEERGRGQVWKRIGAVLALMGSLGIAAKVGSCLTAQATAPRHISPRDANVTQPILSQTKKL